MLERKREFTLEINLGNWYDLGGLFQSCFLMNEDCPEHILIISLSFYNRYLQFVLYVHDLLNVKFSFVWVSGTYTYIYSDTYSGVQEIIELCGGLVLDPLICIKGSLPTGFFMILWSLISDQFSRCLFRTLLPWLGRLLISKLEKACSRNVSCDTRVDGTFEVHCGGWGKRHHRQGYYGVF